LNPLAAFSASDPAGDGTLTPNFGAIGAVMKLRFMLFEHADPADIAGELFDTINLVQGSRRVNGQWQNFVIDPGASFDQFAPMIPELLEDPQYSAECRAAIIKAVDDYQNEVQPVSEPEQDLIASPDTEEAQNEIDHPQSDERAEHTATDDSERMDAEGHERPLDDSRIDG
jgi:hypothetical protein